MATLERIDDLTKLALVDYDLANDIRKRLAEGLKEQRRVAKEKKAAAKAALPQNKKPTKKLLTGRKRGH